MNPPLPPTAEFLAPRLAKPVAVFGGGVSGRGVRTLLAAFGIESRIYDVKETVFTPAAAASHGLVVFSPGFPPEHPWLGQARAAGLECLGELDFASLFWRGRVIAITGTNGKTTLTEFLTHALGAAGRSAHAAGNIGRPFTQLAAAQRGGAKDMFAICEVSSFQAETLRHFRADATLWTNFAEDHLERHPGLESYFSAKWNLVTRTAERGVFVGTSVERHARLFGRALGGAAVVPTERQPADDRLAGTIFAEYPQRENFLLAAAWWHAQGFPGEALVAAARTFRLGRHRLARVATHEGVTYWNDSKATNFHAVEAALAGFREPVVLIAGGKSKGGDLGGFVHRIAPRVKHALLIGETAPELASHCATFRLAHTTCGSLAEAVRRAAELAAPGDHVLLSPGFASFDMFRSYEDRGDQFEQRVQNLTASAPKMG
jgi:UDP-N-acetylmuramoylalanine--D-glutamate ligase